MLLKTALSLLVVLSLLILAIRALTLFADGRRVSSTRDPDRYQIVQRIRLDARNSIVIVRSDDGEEHIWSVSAEGARLERVNKRQIDTPAEVRAIQNG